MNETLFAMLSAYGPMVAMVIAFYFFLYRPQRAEQHFQRVRDIHRRRPVIQRPVLPFPGASVGGGKAVQSLLPQFLIQLLDKLVRIGQ